MDKYEEFLCNKAEKNRIPISATFEISPICNMDCQMCYIAQKKKEVEDNGGLLDIDFWVNTTKDAMENGLLFLLITGGEPFLYKNFKELYHRISDLGVYICINTNGTLIDEEIVSWLVKRPPRRLNISLYGASNDTYARLCKNPRGFDQVIKTFDMLKENNIMFRINSVLTPDNVGDYMGMVEIAERYRVPLTFSYYMFPPIRKNVPVYGNNLHRLTPKEAAEIGYRYNKDKRTKEQFEEHLQEVCNLVLHPEQGKFYGCEGSTCRAGVNSFWVNWKGEMLPCGIMDYPKVDLKEKNIAEGWRYIATEVDNLKMSKKCSTCGMREQCYICLAAAYTETGRFDGTPEYLCELTSNYVDRLMEDYNNIQ
ncbi:MAG: radical SAM/SPASM domain-containing protein [Intestinibacter sp.]